MTFSLNRFIAIGVFAALLSAWLFLLPADAAQQSYTFRGRGTAHGVGLDMAGVKALAQRNTGFEQILKTYYTGIGIAGGREGESLKVGILNGGELQFTGDGAYTVYANNRGPGTRVARDVITHVTFESGQYVTKIDGVGLWRAADFTRLAPDAGSHIKILNNARRYRGEIEAKRSSSTGLLWAINTINIEDYVKGIAEEPNDWPTEGQRTLAVAARTYALNKKLYSTRWDSENFDIDATMGSQYYLGFDAERSNLVRAVDVTKGRVMVYGGRVIVAAYHGNSGGHTESLENVWGGSPSDYPYLRAVASPWTPVYRWGPKTFTKAQLESIFNSRAESAVGSLISIDLSNKGASGRVRKVRLIGSNGTKEVWGYSQFAAWLGLPSAFIDSDTSDDLWDEYILLQNTNDQAATATLTFIFPDRRQRRISRRVQANTRRSVAVDGLVKKGAVAVKVQSNLPLTAERTVYFANGGDGGGHNSIGATSPSRRWYFAEGRTGADFDTYLFIENPRSAPTVVTATFMPGRGRRVRKAIAVPARSRREIKVDDIPGLASASTPAVVKSRAPVIVDRATYFNHGGKTGGHATVGAKRLSNTWYFAEGFTGAGFEDQLMIFNPNANSTAATVTLHKANGGSVVRNVTVAARSRKTVLLNELLSGAEFGITVTAGAGVVAERTVYFNSGGKTGAHSTVGSPTTSKTWYFAEGDTGPGFDEFLTLVNKSGSQANVNVTYIAEGGGATAQRFHAVEANSRKTITVGGTENLGPGRQAGIKIVSDQEIVAERVIYFSYSGNNGQTTWTGGHVTIGAKAPSKKWYFAEGNTQ